MNRETWVLQSTSCNLTASSLPLESSYNLNLWLNSPEITHCLTLKVLSELPTALISLVSGNWMIISMCQEFAYSEMNLQKVWKIFSCYSSFGLIFPPTIFFSYNCIIFFSLKVTADLFCVRDFVMIWAYEDEWDVALYMVICSQDRLK